MLEERTPNLSCNICLRLEGIGFQVEVEMKIDQLWAEDGVHSGYQGNDNANWYRQLQVLGFIPSNLGEITRRG